jgi:hypothetical protein
MYYIKSSLSKFYDLDTYLATRPKRIIPLPINYPQGASNNLNFRLYQKQLTTSSNNYLNSPIWNKPVSRSYDIKQRNFINGTNRIILEDMQELNK